VLIPLCVKAEKLINKNNALAKQNKNPVSVAVAGL
jgi:hypothetical protein